MAAPRYGMVTDVRNMPSLGQLTSAGLTPLFNANDPGGYNAVQAAMQAAQGNAGLWLPSDTRGAQEYIDWVKSWLAAFPTSKHVDLNIEASGKGAPGTPQWNYTEQVLAALEPYLQGRSWSVSPMANQDDFNYGAAISRGGQIWPQAYHGDMTGMDPAGVVEWVRRNNVPLERIVPLLGSAQQRGWGNLYGIDLPGWQGQLGGLSQQQAAPAAGQSPGAVAPAQAAAQKMQVPYATPDWVKSAMWS